MAVIGYGLSCSKGIRGSVIGYTIHIIVTGNCEIQGGGIRYRIRIDYGISPYRDGIDREEAFPAAVIVVASVTG